MTATSKRANAARDDGDSDYRCPECGGQLTDGHQYWACQDCGYIPFHPAD